MSSPTAARMPASAQRPGKLDLDKFKFWLRRDYVFLIEHARLLGLAVARSPDLRR
jgi:thiaminase/transcriptional activator TenA